MKDKSIIKRQLKILTMKLKKISRAPPVDYKECRYIATDSKMPYTYDFDGADTGKTAFYLLRWVNNKGETGPWRPLAQATITG